MMWIQVWDKMLGQWVWVWVWYIETCLSNKGYGYC